MDKKIKFLPCTMYCWSDSCIEMEHVSSDLHMVAGYSNGIQRD